MPYEKITAGSVWRIAVQTTLFERRPLDNFTALRLETSVFFYDHQQNGIFKYMEEYVIISKKMVVSNVV
jgi:hypothetical protein